MHDFTLSDFQLWTALFTVTILGGAILCGLTAYFFDRWRWAREMRREATHNWLTRDCRELGK